MSLESKGEKSRYVERQVIIAAVEWWKMHRPAKWSMQEHFVSPAVNTGTADEAALANAVAEYLKYDE